MSSIKENLETLKRDLPSNVKLVVVSKKKTPSIILEAFEAGQKVFAENYVQEFVEKYESLELKDLDIEWHFIGHLQRNKVKYIIDKVSLIQSVSSLKLAEEIDSRARQINKIQDILVEINIGEEESKSGISLDDLDGLLEGIGNLKNINLKGLMIIPPWSLEAEETKDYFVRTQEIFEDIGGLEILSMGMSSDWKEAVSCGSTMIRVGTAILGDR